MHCASAAARGRKVVVTQQATKTAILGIPPLSLLLTAKPLSAAPLTAPHSFFEGHDFDHELIMVNDVIGFALGNTART